MYRISLWPRHDAVASTVSTDFCPVIAVPFMVDTQGYGIFESKTDEAEML